MNNQHVIYNSLKEYDSIQPVIRYLIKNTRMIPTKSYSDSKRSTFQFVDNETNEVVLETDIEILGIYYDKFDIWSWAWSFPDMKHSEIFLIKELLIYALGLGNDFSYIKSLLITSRGKITDRTQIDINVAIAGYLTKQPYIYPYIHPINNDKLYYYTFLLNNDGLNELAEKIKKNGLYDDTKN